MKCPLCKHGNGKRVCKINSAQSICPPCCAKIRTDVCEGCSYYGPCLAYQREKQVSQKHLTVEILPEVDDRCHEALELAEMGKLAQAEAILEDLHRQHPKYHMVCYGIGACHVLRGDLDQAISCFEQVVEIFPILANAHYNLGVAYTQQVKLDKAVEAYERAITVDGRDGEVGRLARKKLDDLADLVRQNSGVSLAEYLDNLRVYDQAFAALREGQYPLAIRLFAQVLKTDKNHVQSYGNMGLAYASLGNRRKALECLDKAIELDPGYEPAILNRQVVSSIAEGHALRIPELREISYYRDFRGSKGSFLQYLSQELAAQGKVSFNDEHSLRPSQGTP